MINGKIIELITSLVNLDTVQEYLCFPSTFNAIQQSLDGSKYYCENPSAIKNIKYALYIFHFQCLRCTVIFFLGCQLTVTKRQMNDIGWLKKVVMMFFWSGQVLNMMRGEGLKRHQTGTRGIKPDRKRKMVKKWYKTDKFNYSTLFSLLKESRGKNLNAKVLHYFERHKIKYSVGSSSIKSV